MLVQFEIRAIKDEARVMGLVLRENQGVTVDLDESASADLQKKVDAGEIAVKGMKPSAPKADKK